jgi:hypothetical protein
MKTSHAMHSQYFYDHYYDNCLLSVDEHKSKMFPLLRHHSVKANGGSGGIAPRILTWVLEVVEVSLTLRPL